MEFNTILGQNQVILVLVHQKYQLIVLMEGMMFIQSLVMDIQELVIQIY